MRQRGETGGWFGRARRFSRAAVNAASNALARVRDEGLTSPQDAGRILAEGAHETAGAVALEVQAAQREDLEREFTRRRAEQIRFLPFHSKHDQLDRLRPVTRAIGQPVSASPESRTDGAHLLRTRGGILSSVLPRLTYYERALEAYDQLLIGQEVVFSEVVPRSAGNQPLQRATKTFLAYVRASKASLQAAVGPKGGRLWPRMEHDEPVLRWALPGRSEHSVDALVGGARGEGSRTFTAADALPLLVLVDQFRHDFPDAPVAKKPKKSDPHHVAQEVDVKAMLRDAFRALLTECPFMLDNPHEHPGLQLVQASLEQLVAGDLSRVRARRNLRPEHFPPSQALRTLSRISIFYAVFAPVLVRLSALSVARGGREVFDLHRLRSTWLEVFDEAEHFGMPACLKELRSFKPGGSPDEASEIRSDAWTRRLQFWMKACLGKPVLQRPGHHVEATLKRLGDQRISGWGQLVRSDQSPFIVAHYLSEVLRAPYGRGEPSFAQAYRVLDVLHRQSSTASHAEQQGDLVRQLEALQSGTAGSMSAARKAINQAVVDIVGTIQERFAANETEHVSPEGTNPHGYCNRRQVLESTIRVYAEKASLERSNASGWLEAQRSLAAYRLTKLVVRQEEGWLTDDFVYGGKDTSWGALIRSLNDRLSTGGMPRLPLDALKLFERLTPWQQDTFLPWMQTVVEACCVEAVAKAERAEALRDAFQAKHRAYQRYKLWSVNVQILLGFTMVATVAFTLWWMVSLSPLAQLHGMHRALLALPGSTAYHAAFYLVPALLGLILLWAGLRRAMCPHWAAASLNVQQHPVTLYQGRPQEKTWTWDQHVAHMLATVPEGAQRIMRARERETLLAHYSPGPGGPEKSASAQVKTPRFQHVLRWFKALSPRGRSVHVGRDMGSSGATVTEEGTPAASAGKGGDQSRERSVEGATPATVSAAGTADQGEPGAPSVPMDDGLPASERLPADSPGHAPASPATPASSRSSTLVDDGALAGRQSEVAELPAGEEEEEPAAVSSGGAAQGVATTGAEGQEAGRASRASTAQPGSDRDVRVAARVPLPVGASFVPAVPPEPPVRPDARLEGYSDVDGVAVDGDAAVAAVSATHAPSAEAKDEAPDAPPTGSFDTAAIEARGPAIGEDDASGDGEASGREATDEVSGEVWELAEEGSDDEGAPLPVSAARRLTPPTPPAAAAPSGQQSTDCRSSGARLLGTPADRESSAAAVPLPAPMPPPPSPPPRVENQAEGCSASDEASDAGFETKDGSEVLEL